jgi:hypothetical protein
VARGSKPESIEDIDPLETAAVLARLRRENERTLTELGFPTEFSSGQPPAPPQWAPLNMRLKIDRTVPLAFLGALEDGVVTTEEIIQIVELPANRELLEHSSCSEWASTRPIAESELAYHISRAGSSDPHDRLWCWLSPMHHLGYADLALNRYEYRMRFEQLLDHEEEIIDAVLTRVAPFLPTDIEIQETVALSVCCPMSFWSTPSMVGVNVEHLKGRWEHFVGIVAAAVFDQLQRRLCPAEFRRGAFDADDLDGTGPPGSRSQSLEWAIRTVVFRGLTDYVADLGAAEETEDAVRRGAALLHRYATVGIGPPPSSSIGDAPLVESDPERSLCALGRRMARIITAYEGPQAITDYIRRGPAALIVRAAEIESIRGHDLLNEEAYAVIRDLPGHG